MDVDVFEEVCTALLNGEPIPQEFTDPIYESTIAECQTFLDQLEFRGGRLAKKLDGFYARAEQRESALFFAHSIPTTAHGGIPVTLARLQGTVWWPSREADVESYIKLCGICQRSKHQSAPSAPIQALPEVGTWERIHIDLMGPLTQTSSGNKYILTVTDAGTKYITCIPLQDKKAQNVAEHLVNDVFLTYGFPKNMVTDQGAEFCNQLNTVVAAVSGVAHRQTAPYHPASNGQAERPHKDLMTMLRALSSPTQENWDTVLQAVAFAYNTSVRRPTGMTPFFLMFGRHPYTILDIKFDIPYPTSDQFQSIRLIQSARQLAAQRDGRARRASAAQIPTQLFPLPLKPGDLVLAKFPASGGDGLSSKLKPLQEGPYEVKEIRNQNTLLLQNVRNPKDRIERSIDLVIPWRGNTHAEATNEWEIEKIMKEKGKPGTSSHQYLVQWKGFSPDHDSWVNAADVNAEEVIAAWQREKALETSPTDKESKIIRKDVPLPPKDKEELIMTPMEVVDQPTSKIAVILNHKNLRNGIQYEVVLKDQRKSKWMAASKIDSKDPILIAYNRTHNISS